MPKFWVSIRPGTALNDGNAPDVATVEKRPYSDPKRKARDLEILRAAVKNRDGFVRYLQLLLGDWQPFSVGGGKGSKGKTAGAGADDPVPLFELMVRMLAHDPSRLSNIAKVVDRLRRESKDDETVMPPEFLKIWASFEPVLREMQL